jgi:phosphate starvation-inducible PhoH-like protein
LGVYIAARGNKLQIEGEAEQAARARDVLTGLYNRIVQGQEVDAGTVEAVIAMSAEPTLDGIIRTDVSQPPPVMIRTRKKTIVPRSATQIRYMEALARDEIIFALGPAGTGKTYVAVAQAVQQLIAGSVDRLILSRPAVEAGEKLGFLPGDMREIPICGPCTTRSTTCCRPSRSSGASPRARSRSRRSPSCAAARSPMPSSSSTRRRTPRRCR